MTDPSDAERYPTLSEAGRHMLQRLREHPHAPMFKNESGNRLTQQDVETVRAFQLEVAEAVVADQREESAPWLGEFLAGVYRDVPHLKPLLDALGLPHSHWGYGVLLGAGFVITSFVLMILGALIIKKIIDIKV